MASINFQPPAEVRLAVWRAICSSGADDIKIMADIANEVLAGYEQANGVGYPRPVVRDDNDKPGVVHVTWPGG